MPPWLKWSVVALLSWGLWAVLSKLVGTSLSAPHSQALSTVGLLPVMAALLFSGNVRPPRGSARGLAYALTAGAFGAIGNLTYYEALNRGGKAATVVPLTALYPLVTIILAVLLLRERLNKVQILGVLLSLGAIYLFNVPPAEGFLSPELAYALPPILLWGIAGFLQKSATNSISGELSTLAFLAAFIPVALVILAREPLPHQIALKIWMMVSALGFFFALGNFGLLAAFAHGGKASVITPLTALYPVISVPIAIVFLGEKIGSRETIGIVLALSSVAALCYETPESVKTVATPPAH